tara:strand:+ start:1236 stop:1700 length:465 start_codon:yes stop_codon:yes gene_type:complete
MPSVTFDGANKIIQLTTGGEYEVDRDIYSAWKLWVALSDNAKYARAFDTTGGDGVSATQSIGKYFFIRNDSGWRIRTPDVDSEVTLNGNIYARVTGVPVYVRAGGYDSLVTASTSVNAVILEVSTGSGSGLTATEGETLDRIDTNTKLTLNLTY